MPIDLNETSQYGRWGIALVMIVIVTWLVFKYLKPKNKREWKTTGILEAFLIALYAEMYGFPLTIYILTAVFGIDIPFLHIKGHLWASLFGLSAQWAIYEMLIGYSVMGLGIVLVTAGWKKIYQAKGGLVTDGIYRYTRHPQYTGIILITIGALIHWPTLLTAIMWPILLLAYYKLARKEEKDAAKKFGEEYKRYKTKTPMFLPSYQMLLSLLKKRKV